MRFALSLRTRLMCLTVGLLTAGLLVAGVIVIAVLGLSLQRNVDAEATRTGEAVAALIRENALPEPVPVTGEQLVQVVDGRSRVLAASINADRLVPMLYDRELADLRGGGETIVSGDRVGVRGPLRVVAVPAGDRTVLVGKPMSDLRHSVHVVRDILLIAFPLLLIGLAAVTWRVVGATLRPVEQLRAGAAEITSQGRPASLPVPASHDEIHRLAVTLNDMLGRLDAARARQRAFVADAAHELRSPLTNMRTQLEVAQHLGDRAGWSEAGEDLLADVRRLGRLVDDLLLLARADDARADQRRLERVELGGLLRAVAQRYAGVDAGSPTTAGVDAGPPTTAGVDAGSPMIAGGPTVPQIVVEEAPEVWVEAEPDALTRVVANLVDNALRYARTRIVLRAEPVGPDAVVTVTDDGPGIPEADRERVFERFARLDDARGRAVGGAGLGLAIVRELVHRHGGTVTLADAAPGVRAEVRLPRVSASATVA